MATVGSWRQRKRCALCRGGDLQVVLDLGMTPLANEYLAKPAGDQEVFPLFLTLCRTCGHLQMGSLIDPFRLFSNYKYVTGTSEVTRRHLADYARELIERFSLNADSFVVEIGSNDGTMLKAFQQGGVNRVLGVDPATEIAVRASGEGVPTLARFFCSSLVSGLVEQYGVANLIVANNVFAHAEDLLDIAEGVKKFLKPHGVFVFEVSYLRDVVDRFAFDTIYHEHFSYHAIKPLEEMFGRLQMRILETVYTPAQLGRGSLRVYVKAGGGPVIAHREGLRESQDHLFAPATYAALGQQIKSFGDEFRWKLAGHRNAGKRLAGYGAAAKTTTLMYAAGLTREHCEYLVDDSPWKQGCVSPGLHIPIVPPATLQISRPDAVVIYAWNFAESIIEKYKGSGIRFIVPLPTYREVVA